MLLIGGGILVPAVALSGVLVALPASAQDFHTKSDLTTAFGLLNAGDTETFTLQGDGTAPGDDVQEVPDGTDVTIDLNGNSLALDELKIGDGATLTVVNAQDNTGSLIVGGSGQANSGIIFEGGGHLVINGADVDATGSAGNAGIGSDAGSVGRTQTVEIKGDAVVSATGGSQAAGIGGGAGSDGATVLISERAHVTANAGAPSGAGKVTTAIGAGEDGASFGGLSVGTNAILTVGAGSTLRIPDGSTVANRGELDLAGDLGGEGTIVNYGRITGAGTIGAHVHVTRNNYTVTTNLNGGTGSNAPGSSHLYAPKFTAFSGYTAPTRAGYHFTGWKITGQSSVKTAAQVADVLLDDVDTNGAVEIVAQWSQDIAYTGTGRLYVQKDVAGPIDLGIQGDGISVVKTSGSLPTGLTLTSAGKLTGTPTRAATSTFTVNVTSAYETTPRPLTFRVSVGAAAAVTTTTVPLATIGQSYSATIEASGAGDVDLSSTDMPAGLQLNSDGTISGTPTGAEGDIVFHVTATSEYGTATSPLTLHLGAVPQVTTASLPVVKLGQAYSQTLAASGRGTKTFSIAAGALPAGLSLNTSTGAITGTATGSATTANFAVDVSTDYGHSTQAYSVAVGRAPSITTTGLDPVKLGVAYTTSLAADGDSSKTFTLANGSTLPTGLNLLSDGTLSGTYNGPAVSASFTVNVHSTFGDDQKSFSIVAGAVPAITTTTLPVAKIGQVYTGSVVASGDGTKTFSLTQSSAAMPAGLTLHDDGTITGTPTGAAGDVSIRVHVSTIFGTDDKTYTVHVGSVPAFTSTTLDTWASGTAHTQAVPATGTDATYAVTVGTLPTGLTLSSAGSLSGSVDTHRNTTFTITATSIYGSASRQFTLRVGDAPHITTTRTAQATVGSYYEATLVTTGDELSDAHFTVDAGTLPAGLTLNETTGVISGYATDPGSQTFTVKVVTPFGDNSQQYTLRTGTTPSISTATLPAIATGAAYTADLAVSGTGGSSANYRVTTGALPTGLVLNQTNGHISGTVSAVGDTTFTITATTDFGTTQRAFTVTAGDVPVITTAASSVGVIQVGSAFTLQLGATGTGARTWSVTGGTLPAGLALNATTGVLSGTATDAGNASVTVKAESIYGSDSKTYSLRVGTVPAVSTSPLDPIVVGVPYSGDLTATGTGSSSAVFDVTTGTLPTGLVLNRTTGHLSGTVQAAGDTTFTVTATTDFGTATRVYTVHAGIAPTITTSTVAVMPVGQSATRTLAADGTGTKTWTLDSGTLPAGLSLNGTTGVLSGTPSAAGSTNVVFKVVTDYGVATRSYTLRTGTVPSVSTESLPAITVGSVYGTDLVAAGSGTATFAVTTGALPTGLSLNGTTGHISGTVQTAGTTTFTVTATSDFGTAQKEYTVTAGVAPAITSGTPAPIVVGQPVVLPLFASGTAGRTWTVDLGTLPAGLTLNGSTGVISGTATTAGSASIRFKVSTAYGVDTKTLTLRTGVAPSITTDALPVAIVDSSSPYSADLAIEGSGTDTASFSITGTLPAGITFDTATGHFGGTATEAGDRTVTVSVITAFGTVPHQLTIHAGVAPTVSTADLDSILTGRQFSQQLATSGTGGAQWTLDSGTLPTGLTLAANGVLSGTATADGDFEFTVKATSDYGVHTKHYAVTVGTLPVIATQALPGGTVGTAYSTRVAVTGAAAGQVSITGGTLPAGLAYDAATGVVSGTPTAAGSSTVTLTATNRFGSVHRDLTVAVAAAPVVVTPTPTQTTAPAPAPKPAAPVLPKVGTTKAKFGMPFSLSFAASSTASVQYAAQGHLPDGLTLNTYTGVLSGTPKEEGSFSFAITASNSGGSVGAQYVIEVPEQATLVSGSATTVTPQMGQAFDVKVAGLKKGERWRIKVDGDTVATGVAAKAGDVTESVTLPKTRKDHTYTVRVSTSRTDDDPSTKAYDEFDVTALVAKKSLQVKGGTALVTVTGLAPLERVSVSEGTKLVAQGRADEDGVFTVVTKGWKAGKHKLVATGKFEDRTGSATVKITK